MAHYNTYGKMALADVDEVIQNGRYYAQQEAEKYIPGDVFSKLPVKPEDNFLDVGCGMGLNLRQAVEYTKNCSACDHENVIGRIETDPAFSDVTFYGGDFLSLDIQEKFSKILIYGVVPALPDEDVLFSFIEKGVSLMKEDGLLLVGDFANIDKKRRFLQSEKGKKFQEEWEKQCASLDQDNPTSQFVSPQDAQAVSITDEMMFDILRTYRKRGFDVYILNQKQNLPFGHTREDILIVGPEYED